MNVVIATPTIAGPCDAYKASLAASAPILEAARLDCKFVLERGNPYISAARATMLRHALDGKADVVVFIDHDVSWRAPDLLTLIETEGDVVAGLYRFKKDEEEYMGQIISGADDRPLLRDDGCIAALWVPAGFLKITKEAVDRFMRTYPDLIYGPRYNASVDLFNHGVMDGVWYGEDVAFSKRWKAAGGEIWVVPDLGIDHHAADGKVYRGQYHEFMLRQPGGSEDPARVKEAA